MKSDDLKTMKDGIDKETMISYKDHKRVLKKWKDKVKVLEDKVKRLEESNKNRQWLINQLKVDWMGIYDD